MSTKLDPGGDDHRGDVASGGLEQACEQRA